MSSKDCRTLFAPNYAVYLTTVGFGTSALLRRAITQVRDVHWPDALGITEALWVLEVKEFGVLIVDCYAQGNSFFGAENAKINARLDATYDGLKEPILRRYSETANRSDEVI